MNQEICNFWPLKATDMENGAKNKKSNQYQVTYIFFLLYYSAIKRPTQTCYVPNLWKFIKDFTELCRFEIAALNEEDNLV